MKMIWGIFKRDMCHATRNVIAGILSRYSDPNGAVRLVQHRGQLGPLRQHQGIEGRRGQ